MKIGIAIDAWKLKIFKRHLDKAGLKFEKTLITPKTLMLSVESDSLEGVRKVVEAAHRECKN